MTGQLGSIKFEGLYSPNSFTHRQGIDYAEHATILGKPRLQRLADKLDEASLTIMLHAQFCDPEEKIQQLKDEMSAGNVLPYSSGAGDIYGNFVITDLEKKHEHLDAQGRIIYTVVSLTLKEFSSPDTIKAAQEKQKTNAFANEQNNPITNPLSTVAPADTVAASATMQTAMSENEVINYELYVANAESPVNIKHFDNVLNSIDKMDAALNETSNKINGFVGQIAAETNHILSYIDIVKNDISILGSLVALADLPSSIAQLTNVNFSVSVLKTQSAPLARIVGSRR
jgi:phage protein U